MTRFGPAVLSAAALVGPWLCPSMAAGQSASSRGFGPFGGNVYSLAADPGAPGTLYAGTARGVFRSSDGGASWVFSSAGIPPTRVQTVIVDPKTPSTLFAGTRTPPGVASVGIFKSTDSGETWSEANVGLFDPVTGFGPVDVDALAVSPADSKVLVAGTDFSELYRSGDGGATWQAVTFGGATAGLQTTSIVFDPKTPGNVYAASTLGFLKSADAGLTWIQFGDAGVPFFSIAIDPATPQTLYAGDATGSGVWKSTNGGSHWTTVNVSLPGASGSRPPILALAVDPSHPSTVYAATYGNGVWVSTNGAASWTAASMQASGMRDMQIATLLPAPSPPSTVYAGTYGGGVYESVDGAATWSKADAGLAAAVVPAVLADRSVAGVVYAATSDGVDVSSDAGVTWSDPGAGLPSVAVAALAQAGGAAPRLLAGTLGSGLYQSADRGATWTPSAGLNDPYVSSLAVDPTSSSVVFAGTAHPFTGSNSERVFKSMDGGATWAQTSLDAGGFSVDFLGVNPGHPAQVFAGSGGASGLFRSLDGGTTWSTIATDVCGGNSAVAFDAPGSTVYLAGTTGVCRSADGGATWSVAGVGGGLAVVSVLVDPSKPGTLYAGASPDLTAGIDGGVFVSTDGGLTFTALDAGVPPSAVDALASDPATGVVYAGTFGAGVVPIHTAEDREPPAAPPASGRRPPRTVDPR